QAVCELHDQNAVGHHNSDHHDDAHERHHVQRSASKQKREEDSHYSSGNCQENEQGVEERPELSDQDKIEQNKRKQQAQPETSERRFHSPDHSANIHSNPLRKLSFLHDVAYRRGYTAKVLGGRTHIHVEDALDLVVIDLR